MIINNTEIKAFGFRPSREELANYVEFIKNKVGEVDRIDVRLADNDNVDITWIRHNQKFERIRRITGYLTGDLKSWNNAKQSEERDRVKHGVKL